MAWQGPVWADPAHLLLTSLPLFYMDIMLRAFSYMLLPLLGMLSPFSL